MKIFLPVLLLVLPLVSCERETEGVVQKSGIKKAGLPDDVVDMQQLERLHRQAVAHFEVSQGFGWNRMRFSREPKDGQILTDRAGMKWRVESLELVSLLENDPPMVYTLPFDSTHAGAETLKERKKRDVRSADEREFVLRDLTGFEKKALGAIRKDATLLAADAAKQEDGYVHFMGAITAEQECLKCHEGKQVGDVLGAFTWALSAAVEGDGKMARR